MTTARPSPNYRPDIDGLRALAVISVVLYHAQISVISGGYVGVDIFFVISGFLITRVIFAQINEQKFSVFDFYERRARRILPALFLVTAVTLAAATIFYFPGDFEAVPKSALAALFFAANIWFFSQSDYFAGASEDYPLLHMWSLGIEEQFYLIFPIILILCRTLPSRKMMATLIAITCASFALAVYKQGDGDGFAFYLLPTRMWELLVGAALALGALPQVRSQRLREVLSGTGMIIICVPFILYDKATTFPGISALPPVLGAALVIQCAPQTRIGRVLSHPVLVGIGLMSYSLYLWHWPIIVFTRYVLGGDLSIAHSAAAFAGSMAAAWLSLRYIETPFRDRTRFSSKAIWALCASGFAALSAACLALIALGPWEGRFSPKVLAMSEAMKDISPTGHLCLTTNTVNTGASCNFGAQNIAPTSMLWGDSHGVEMAYALGEKLRPRGRALAQRTLGSCPPIIGFDAPENPMCVRLNARIFNEIAKRKELKTIYLSGFWASENYRTSTSPSQFVHTVRALQALGRNVVVIGAYPRQSKSVPRALARAAAYDLPPPPTTSAASYRADIAWFMHAVSQLNGAHFRFIDPARAFIKNGQTRILHDDKVLYYDSHHITVSGAQLVLDANGYKG